jgi:3-oxoadipate enol-lactonase
VFTEDVLRVLDFLGAEKVHLVGLSMGGRIARNVALAHPGRLKSLVLANTSPGFGALSPEAVRDFVAQRRSLDPAAQAKRLVSPRAQPGAYEALVQSLSAVHRDAYLKTVEASVTQDLAAPIEQIQVPTLVITSDGDTLYSPSLARDMARSIPGAKLVEIADAGHVSNLDQPERFNEAVLKFLRAQSRPSDLQDAMPPDSSR